jgi:hypothetical protein
LKKIFQCLILKMKKENEGQTNIQDSVNLETSLDTSANACSLSYKNLKKGIYLTGLVCAAFFFHACMVGYAETEPVYVESVRPAAPSSVHVWIDGDWAYNRHTHGYVRNQGYWVKPAPNKTYVQGHWQAHPQGHTWTRGHWQRQGHQSRNDRR